MQDKQTGQMVPLPNLDQESRDRAIPDRRRQGVILSIGEIVEVKGGTFRVRSIGRKMVMLEGIPGTVCEEG